MCLEVPDGGRFLQNGFDGFNCKGLEWDHVALLDASQGRFPWNRGFSADEELRLLYVAVSRARRTVAVSHTDEASIHVLLLRELTRKVIGTGGQSGNGGVDHSKGSTPGKVTSIGGAS